MAVVKPWSVGYDRFFLAAVLFCFTALGLTGWLLFGRARVDTTPKSTKLTHMHCPKCLAEQPYRPIQGAEICEECESEVTFVPSVGPFRDSDSATAQMGGRILVFGSIAGILVPLLVFLANYRLRALRRAVDEKENERLIWHCPFCQGKISYPISKVGSGVLCSRCKTAFTLAPPDEEPRA